MKIPQVINRFNLYRNGTKLIGTSGEVELPEVTNLTDTVEGAGTGGNLEIPVIGLTDTMDIQIPYTTLSKDAFSMMNPNEAADLLLSGAIQGMDSGTEGRLYAAQYCGSRRGQNLYTGQREGRGKDGVQCDPKSQLLQDCD